LRRAGYLAIALLVCLAVAVSQYVNLIQLCIRQVKTAGEGERADQAQWLLETGVSRALAQLDQAPDYRGETWDVDAGLLNGKGAGRVRITVARPPQSSAGLVLTVEADFPADSPCRVRCRCDRLVLSSEPTPP
jgi:hypothetical protein